jgi:hypothetical protein
MLFYEQQLRKRMFNALMRNILICACARRMRIAAVSKRSREVYVKTFLSLKQNWCIKNLVRQKREAYRLVLKTRAFEVLMLHKLRQRLLRIVSINKDRRMKI